MNWMIAGATQALAEMQEHGRILLTEAQQQRVDALLNEADVVRRFAATCLIRQDHADVTVRELEAKFQAFCQEHQCPTITPRQFENRIPAVMMELFRANKRTDIIRHGHHQRGFARVALKPEVDRE